MNVGGKYKEQAKQLLIEIQSGLAGTDDGQPRGLDESGTSSMLDQSMDQSTPTWF